MTFVEFCSRVSNAVPDTFGEVLECSISFNRIDQTFCAAVNVERGAELSNVITFEARNKDKSVAQVNLLERLWHAV